MSVQIEYIYEYLSVYKPSFLSIATLVVYIAVVVILAYTYLGRGESVHEILLVGHDQKRHVGKLLL